MSGGFDDDEDFDELVPESTEAVDPSVLLPAGGAVEEEIWDEADFDEDFDEDFADEPDEDLERFENELNDENVQSPTAPDDDEEFDEDF